MTKATGVENHAIGAPSPLAPYKRAFAVRHAIPDDVSDLVDVHLACFGGGFLTFLGKDALKAYYDFFVRHPLALCYVATQDGAIVALVSGWEQGASYQAPLARTHGSTMALSFLRAMIRHPRSAIALASARLDLLATMTRYWWSPAAWLSRGASQQSLRPTEQDSKSDVRNGSLLSLAVLPSHRGHGIAGALCDTFLTECRRRKIPRLLLTVATGNDRARRFYEHVGWEFFRQVGPSTHYIYTL